MNHTHSHRILVITLTSLSSLLPSALHAAGTGSSHNLFVVNKLDKDSSFVFRANTATRDGLKDAFFGYVDANYRKTLTDHWSVEAGYRQAYLKLGNKFREEYRPMFSLYWRDKLWGGKFSNRHRLEFRYFEGDAEDRMRYRNESVWRSNKTITDYHLTPFIEEEFFYDITGKELNTNWITLGVSKSWAKGKKWKLGYRLQSQKFNGQWENRHVLVTGISFFLFD